MKVAMIKSRNYVCDENSAGFTSLRKLSCQIFLAASYCRSIGINADVFNLNDRSPFLYENYDIIVVWVPLYEGFYSSLFYLEKAKNSGKITIMILNDPLDTLEMEAMKRFSYIDYAIRLHERESTLGFLVKELENGNTNNFPANSGLIFRNNSGLHDTGKRPPFLDLKHLPSTAGLIKNEPIDEYREIFIEAGRGCPFSCTFCFYNSTPQRKRDFKDILSELKTIGDRAKHIWLHDLNMLANEKWVNDLCDILIAAGTPAKWGTDARLDECENVALLKKMKKAGCSLLVFGIESADPEILKKINKRIDLKLIDAVLQNCNQAGIKAEFNIMYGFPWDNDKTMKETEDFIKRYPVTCIMLVRPQIGTFLYDEYKKLGLMNQEMTLDNYIFSKKYPMFPTLYLSRKEVYRWHKRFETTASNSCFKRKIEEVGLASALAYWINIKGFKLLNIKKIFQHILNH